MPNKPLPPPVPPPPPSNGASLWFSRGAIAPAERVLAQAEVQNARVGHENAGFLSSYHGFLPSGPPLTALSAPFAAWDQLGAELPALHRSLDLRRQVEALPLLDAASLPDHELLRASALLSITAHAYWYVETHPPSDLPLALRYPWAQVRGRLTGGPEVLSYVDLVVYNWRLRDPARARVVENLDLLVPTIGNREERVFYLTQLEILARATPVISLTARAQSAVLAEDDRALEGALLGIAECLAAIVRRSLLKLDPNPFSRTHVNPVVWAKTVAPLAVPFHDGVQGPSGTSSPLFNTLDIFFGRKGYRSFLGREIQQLRASYPAAWQSFLDALAQVSVGGYIERRKNPVLEDAWAELLELYAGPNGFLGRHRMKVYGYLELAFKVGRSVTIGGFSGVFKDRTWDRVDGELLVSQGERPQRPTHFVHRARVSSMGLEGPARKQAEWSAEAPSGARVRSVHLDVAHLSLRYQPGDRCLVLPENDPSLVARTLKALDARGDEWVELTVEWKALAGARPELTQASHVKLEEVLRFGDIRSVGARVAEALHAHTQSRGLLARMVDGRTEEYELCELLEELRAEGLDPATLWSEPQVAVSARLTRLIPPLRFRVYSISSTSHDARGVRNKTLELTVGKVSYPRRPRPGGALETEAHARAREGTASSFLLQAKDQGRSVPFCIERPIRFNLPADPRTPVVLFAAGGGVAPFRAFLEERSRRPSGESEKVVDWLFLSLRSPDEYFYEQELARFVDEGRLQLRVGFTRDDPAQLPEARVALRDGRVLRIEDLMLTPQAASALWKLSAPKSAGGAEAQVYICGHGGFATRVIETLRRIFRNHVEDGSEALADELLHRLSGEGRLVQEIHTGSAPAPDEPRRFDLSEIADHNSAARGYWLVIDRSVYDLTEFMQLHPGGRRVVEAYAGTDATHGFARAHHQRADVDAMRESYRIGVVRAHVFDDHAVRVEGPRGPVSVDCTALYRAFAGALHLVVEMQNALDADHSLQAADLDGTEEPHARTPYKLSRGLDTHQRFRASYLNVLTKDTLPGLWSLARGLLFPDQPASWMVDQLAQAEASDAAQETLRLCLKVTSDFGTWKSDPRIGPLHDVLASGDAWCLAAIKRALIESLREFERHGAETRQLGAAHVRDSCQRLAFVVRHYHARLGRELAEAVGEVTRRPDGAEGPPPDSEDPALRRLHAGTYWTLEEDPSRRLVVLLRTPTPLGSLTSLREENDEVLTCLSESHRECGLVVDMRRAPMRNDPEFEGAMAQLRSGVTGHFRRTAVLLESMIGELQVMRLERDARRPTLATQSESNAVAFARGLTS